MPIFLIFMFCIIVLIAVLFFQIQGFICQLIVVGGYLPFLAKGDNIEILGVF